MPQTRAQTPVFRAATDYFETNVLVRDTTGKFVPNLRPEEFQVFEDGVPQKVQNFSVSVGGRVLTDLTPRTVAAPREGLILPRYVPPADTSGRIFIIFIDDMHILPGDSIRARSVLEQIRDTVVHENDLIGIVSTGYSSIATDITYDLKKTRFNEAIKKTMGSAMTPDEIIRANQTNEGPAGVRYNANVAFSTAYDILANAAKVTNRRKAFLYLSSGYDFNPFKDSRFKYEQELYERPDKDDPSGLSRQGANDVSRYENPFERDGRQFAETDLVAQLAELTRAARRANVTFYSIDPRGLNAGPDINTSLGSTEWRDHLQTSISSLRVLGDETGGFCICNTNDFRRGLQRIDNEMSDYYVIGYVSNNPDPLKIRRRVEIKTTRQGLMPLIYRDSYTIQRSGRK